MIMKPRSRLHVRSLGLALFGAALSLAALPLRAQIDPAYVGSLGGLSAGTVIDRAADFSLSPPQRAAVGITIGGTAQSFVSFNLAAWDNRGFNSTIEGGIYSNNGGNPGTLLGAFTPQASSTTPQVYAMALSSGSVVLEAGTTYWFVVHDVGIFGWAQTTDSTTVLTTGGASFLGWDASFNSGTSWSGASLAGLSDPSFGPSSPQFDLYTTAAIPEFSTSGALVGILVLGAAVAIRRRKRAVTPQAA
jgi:MYXO-CTERM domain-containing protein